MSDSAPRVWDGDAPTPLPLWYARRRASYLEGNEVELLRGGQELFPAMRRAIDSARYEVMLATYLFHSDAQSEQLALALAQAARRGVRVRVVVDGFGSIHGLAALSRWWKEEGVAWSIYRPMDRWWTWFQPEHLRRLHQKLCVVDAELAFIGGINIIDDRLDIHHGWMSQPRLDFAVQVRGPVVEPMVQTVRAMWTRATFGADWRDELQSLMSGRRKIRRARALLERMRLPRGKARSSEGSPSEFPTASASASASDSEATRPHSVQAAFLLRDNLRQRHSIEAALLEAFAGARHSIDLACPYFYPGVALRRALSAAASRGVRVRLLLQGQVDYRIAAVAARLVYRELLGSGVQIFEYLPAFLHAKVARVDDHWATVGSSNLDPLSMLVNFEANLAVRDGPFVKELARALEEAFAHSREITAPPRLSTWSRALQSTFVATLARLYLRMAGVSRPY